MKYTPGPWKYSSDLSAIVVIEDHKIKAIADFGKIEHHEENAKLIEDAPTMKAYIKYVEEYLSIGEFPFNYSDWKKFILREY